VEASFRRPLELLIKASKQSGSFGNQVREALKNIKL